MKDIRTLFMLFVILAFVACTDPIDVDLPYSGPRITIDASLDWEKGTSGNEQSIRLSTSQPYFDTIHSLPVRGAQVKVTNLTSGEEFVFVDQDNGTYSTSSFVPILNNDYRLEVDYNGEQFEALERMTPFTGINRITQSVEGGFDDELIEVTTYWDDPVDEENFYIVRYDIEGDLFPDFEWTSDEFTNGNELDDFYERDDDDDDNGDDTDGFVPGDELRVTVIGASETYYNYMNILLEQYYNSGNPYSPTPAQVRGNCINKTNPANFPFGYFRVCEVDSETYVIQ